MYNHIYQINRKRRSLKKQRTAMRILSVLAAAGNIFPVFYVFIVYGAWEAGRLTTAQLFMQATLIVLVYLLCQSLCRFAKGAYNRLTKLDRKLYCKKLSMEMSVKKYSGKSGKRNAVRSVS